MSWHKGCLCGCLTPEECLYYKPRANVSHVVHHVFVHQDHTETIDVTQVALRRECPACGRTTSVNEAGNFYRHKSGERTPGWAYGSWCSGRPLPVLEAIEVKPSSPLQEFQIEGKTFTVFDDTRG